MLSLDNNTKAFLELVRAGLWEKEARLSQFGRVDYEEVMRPNKIRIKYLDENFQEHEEVFEGMSSR